MSVRPDLPLPTWPGGARVAVALTFDVDGDPAVRGSGGEGVEDRLGLLSQFRYGLVRGLPRIISLLARRELPATFFVPGATALAYPDSLRSIVAAGHEVAHHGHDHLVPSEVSAGQQRDEIERGLEALQDVAGVRPRGYRAPGAELTPETLRLLVDHGMEYDSSCQGDDRPYVEAAGSRSILEFPIDWRLDDAAFMLQTPYHGGRLEHPGDVLRQWWEDFLLATAEGTLLTLTMHPEIMGRGSRLGHLAELVDRMSEHTEVWYASLGEVVDLMARQGIRPADGGAEPPG